MGCGQSTQPNKETNSSSDAVDNSITPVEVFDASTADEPESGTTSRQPREETIAAAAKKSEDSSAKSSTFSSPANSPFAPSAASSQKFAANSPLTAEQRLPNPFSRPEEQPIGVTSPPANFGGSQAGYTKHKDTKKRGGFDPERFRQANGRGGLVEAAVGNSNSQMYDAGFNQMGHGQSHESSIGGQMGGGMGYAGQGHQMQGAGAQSQPMQGMDMMSMHDSGNNHPQQQQQQWHQPRPDYISAPEFQSKNNPNMMEMSDHNYGGSNAGRPTYGALGWPESTSPPQQRKPSGPLNRTDEQELDDILEEFRDV